MADDAVESYHFSKQDAIRYFDLLVEAAGAYPDECAMFVSYMCKSDSFPKEYRFRGKLGFGGKARLSADGRRPRIDCYPEDMTDERREIIDTVNAKLKEMFSCQSAQ